MKKHFVLIMNILLVVILLGAVGFTIFNIATKKDKEKTATPESPTTAVVLSSDAATEMPTVDPAERYKIGIIQHHNNADSNDCYAGFISELNDRGLVGNVDIMYIIEEDEKRCDAEIKRLIDEKCDLLCTIGAYTSTIAASMTTEIPIVFAGIADPEKAGLIHSNESPGGNITGVSSYTPAFEQIDLIKMLFPQTVNIASIYTSTDEYAVTQAIIASKEAEEQGMKLEKYPVTKAAEITDALNAIKKSGAEAIFLPVDNFVYSKIADILAFSDQNKIPVFVGNERMLQAGAFATCTINYTSIGRKAAGQSYDILFGKKNPASLSIIYKYDCNNIVNDASMKKLGVQLNADVREKVTIKDYQKTE